MPGKGDSFREKVAGAKKGVKCWQPEIGDVLCGKYLALRDVQTRKGKSQVIDIENEEDGEVISVWFTVVLHSEFEEQDINIGERVGLHYLGNEKGYHDYIVMVDREGA